jgi:hypothetical protein
MKPKVYIDGKPLPEESYDISMDQEKAEMTVTLKEQLPIIHVNLTSPAELDRKLKAH